LSTDRSKRRQVATDLEQDVSEKDASNSTDESPSENEDDDTLPVPRSDGKFYCDMCEKGFRDAKKTFGAQERCPHKACFDQSRQSQEGRYVPVKVPCSNARHAVASIKTKSGILKHLKKTQKCASKLETWDHSVDPSFSVLPAAAHTPPLWRNGQEALLSALEQSSSSEEEQTKTLIISQKLGQFPIGFSTDGLEVNAIVSRQIHEKLPNTPFLAVINKARNEPGEKLQWEIKEPCLTCHRTSSRQDHPIESDWNEELSRTEPRLDKEPPRRRR